MFNRLLDNLQHRRAFIMARIVLRVIAIFTLWLLLFLSLFLGYFTFPVLIIGFLILVYAFLDFGLFFRMQRQERARQARQEFLRSRQQPDNTP